MKINWRQIRNYHYSVSNDGKVRNDLNGCLLKGWLNAYGYYMIDLSVNNKKVRFPLHRLIAEAFIPNPDNKPCIDHINTIRTDNRIDNLRWVTFKENINNPLTLERLRRTTFRKGDENPKTMTGKFGKLNPVSIPVVQYNLQGEYVAEYECARGAMRATHIACTSITRCCRNQMKTAGGFYWRYKEGAV